MNKKTKSFNIEDKELKQLITDILDNYENNTESQYGTINYKLDSIEKQTTKTNSRVTALEAKVTDIELNDAGRYESCPYNKKIEKLTETVISTAEMKRVLIRAVTIAGVFFTILFTLLLLLIEGGII